MKATIWSPKLSLRLGLSLTFLGVIILGSCQWERKSEPSVLVLAVDSLPYESVNCVDSEDPTQLENGFQILCRESVRFSHTFTPSPLSQVALVSLFTSLWPFEHGVRDNGATALSAQVTTLAEVAFSKGYKTSFFSGGAPIFRKSGIAQGFEVFEDGLPLKPDKIYRSLNESIKQFRNWYESEVSGKKFLSVIYASDLQIFDEPTLDEKGRIVERSYAGRVKRLQSSLLEIFDYLKKVNQWNSTYVILVGLNGYSDQERFNEIASTNLHVENTQVALLIKTPQKTRDLGLSWKIDANISLLDVSKTIFEIFGYDPTPERRSPLFPVVSLQHSLSSAESNWPDNRIIPIESFWPKWKGVGNPRVALRSGSHLYISEDKAKFFNTLTDRLELSPVKPTIEWEEKYKKAQELISPEKWTSLSHLVLHQVDVAINIWDPSGRTGVVQQENEKESSIAGWLALRSIENQNWNQLLRLSKTHSNKYWGALATTNIEGRSTFPESKCMKWSQRRSSDPNNGKDNGKDCGDLMFKNLVGWIKSEQNGGDATPFREAFVRSYRNLMLDRRVSQLNFVNGLSWDVSTVFTQGPVLSELYLNYPENRKFWLQLQDRLKVDSYDGGLF